MSKLLDGKKFLTILLSIAIIFAFTPALGGSAYAKTSKSKTKVTKQTKKKATKKTTKKKTTKKKATKKKTTKKKVKTEALQLVSQSKDNLGDTVKYSYNKKGLVTKKVGSSTKRDQDSDCVTTTTTSYKYNKSNKIAVKTTTKVEKDTYYKTDKTSGQTITGTSGTVTTTTKTVTKYSYKKGNAVKSVATQTETKSGSTQSSGKSREFGSELKDGKLLAETQYDSETQKKRPIYYSGAFDKAVSDSASTTTYRSNGDGSYTEIEESSYTNPNYTRVYIGTDGQAYEDEWNMPEGVKLDSIRVDLTSGENKNTNSYKSETTYGNKSVTTTTYTYDKKNRVKKAAWTKTETSTTTDGPSVNMDTEYYEGKPEIRNSTNYSGDTTTRTDTTSGVTTYSYGKNGRTAKVVTSNPGVKNSKYVRVSALPNRVTETTNTEGRKTTRTVTGRDAQYSSVETTVTANGTRTTTEQPYKYTEDVKETYSDGSEPYSYSYSVNENPEDTKAVVKTASVKTTPSQTTLNFKYDKQMNLKSATVSGTRTEAVTLRNEIYDNTIYELDSENNTVPVETVVTTKIKSKTNRSNTVKKGTTALSKVLDLTNSAEGRATYSTAEGSSTSYTLKVKKFKTTDKVRKLVAAQQWALQNGDLNGEVGLWLR